MLNVGVVGGGVAVAGGLFARSQATAAEAAGDLPKDKLPGFGEFAALPTALNNVVNTVARELQAKGLGDLGGEFGKFFSQAWRECMIRTDNDGANDGVYVKTGDILAMWLRDSAVSVRPYLAAAKDPGVYSAIAGVLRQQMAYVNLDPYANAFRRDVDPLSTNVNRDLPKPLPRVHERKYEVDSLAAPLLLAHALWKASEKLDHVDKAFFDAAGRIVGLWWRETRHENSPYTFRRGDAKWELQREGKGPKVAYTGMTWSGFRPSDDPCSQGYLVPANAMAVVALEGLVALAKAKGGQAELEANARNLGREIARGIAAHGVVPWPTQRNKKIYAFEVSGPLKPTDGGPKIELDDDANIPSLLSLPYLGFCAQNDPTYLNTRARALSKENRWYFEGKASGIGSPHTPKGRQVWPLAIIMQALTTSNPTERVKLAKTVLSTNVGPSLLHESVDVNDFTKSSRDFFNWPNALFSELLMELAGYDLKKFYPKLA